MSDVIDYWNQNTGLILGYLGWHAWLAAVPVLLGLAISLPLGALARGHRLVYAPVITLSGLLYTIPSIALFVVLPGILHTRILDPINVVAALTVYTVSLLVRVVADGLGAVPDHVQQSATAMGYRRFGRFISVELPIAVPVIAAGLRVAAVSNVSLVAVAALIGVDNLGKLFSDGFQRFFLAPIIIGILGCLLLAIVFDSTILLVTRLLTPWTRAVRG